VGYWQSGAFGIVHPVQHHASLLLASLTQPIVLSADSQGEGKARLGAEFTAAL